jgi:hypothetical protein
LFVVLQKGNFEVTMESSNTVQNLKREIHNITSLPDNLISSKIQFFSLYINKDIFLFYFSFFAGYPPKELINESDLLSSLFHSPQSSFIN